MKAGHMAMQTPMVLMLVFGCRVLHYATWFDPVLYNQYVRMRASKRTVSGRRVFRDLRCTRILRDPALLLHVVVQEFEYSFQAPRLSVREYIRVK